MKEEMIDVEVNLGKEAADRIRKMNKTELTNEWCIAVLRSHVQDETIAELEREMGALQAILKRETETLQTKLDKAEAYVEQGRAMIESVMERWYHYDT